MNHTQRTGRQGEALAADYLQKRGYRLVAQNVRTPHGEIDIIAQKDALTVFVEVKTRTSRTFGPPEIAITPRKQAHMLASAAHYAQENGLESWRIDVVAIEMFLSPPRITHFENVIA